MQCSTCPQTRMHFEKLISELQDPRQREVLQTWLDHWWGEVVYDIDAVMATVTPDITYRIYGHGVFANAEFSSAVTARAMYLDQFQQGLMPGCVIDNAQVAFGSWGMTVEGVATMALFGASITQPGVFAPDQLYLVQVPIATFHPFQWVNGKPFMAGEHVYLGPVRAIEMTDRGAIDRLLGRQ